MKHFTLALATIAAMAFPALVRAETPADTLVIADAIDDIVSLDPAESFEFSGNDVLNNVYDRLIHMHPARNFELEPGLAESWSVSDDGLTYTFKMREGITFHSGNPVTAEDAAWSFQRVVKLDKTPAFILTQFGFTAENVDGLIKATSPTELTITTDKVYAPSFFYNILTSIVTSVVDKEEAMTHEVGGDFGYEWLKTNSAGSGPYKLVSWTANDSVVLESVGDYWGGDVALARVFVRHVPESATRRLLLENGDVDLVRRLPPNDVAALAENPDIKVQDEQRGRIFYVSANMKNEILANPKVLEALKYLVDYEGMANSFLKGQFVVHQTFLPSGFLGAIDENQFTLDVEKAKALLAEAGYPDGFSIALRTRNEQLNMDMAQAIQASMGQAGVQVEIVPGTGAEVLGDYRARTHELMLQNWGPDYPDPQTNASTFAANPGNSDEDNNTGYLAWRNAYPAEETNAMVDAAVQEQDTDKRRQMYEEMQRLSQQHSPFICMFQEIEQITMRQNVEGFSTGAAVGSAFYWTVTK